MGITVGALVLSGGGTALAFALTSAPQPEATSVVIADEATASPTPTPSETNKESDEESTSTPTPTVTPTIVRTPDDVKWCGATGVVKAVGETDAFWAVICDDAGGLVYIGTSKETGAAIRLPAQVQPGGYSAHNSVDPTDYFLTSTRLVVTNSTGVLFDSPITSWRTW